MGHLIDFKGENVSGNFDLNLLYQIDNSTVYIMDNHLIASWCWAQQIDLSKKYTLIHIDRHFDLGKLGNVFSRSEVCSNLQKGVRNITEMTYSTIMREDHVLFTWCNYIFLFNEAFPEVINSSYFIVDDANQNNESGDCEYLDTLNPNHCIPINELPNINNSIILNLDIDFFCKCNGADTYDFRDDYKHQIDLLKIWYLKNKENVKVFTIALSPEMCSHDRGWEISKGILMEVSEALELDIKHENIFKKD